MSKNDIGYAYIHIGRPYFAIHLTSILVSNTQIQGQDEEVVTMEYFGKVLAWFGNLKQEGANILEKMKAVVANKYVCVVGD